jgi:hypothetical protein
MQFIVNVPLIHITIVLVVTNLVDGNVFART